VPSSADAPAGPRLPAPGPWASGPREILDHALELLREPTDRNKRLAFILTDQAVELALGVYLGAPSRATGLKFSRRELDEAKASYPALLKRCEASIPQLFFTADPAHLEWFHKLRNSVYHDGNGITVEDKQAHAFAQIAARLITQLFGEDESAYEPAEELDRARHDRTYQFIQRWAEVTELLGQNLEEPEQLTLVDGLPVQEALPVGRRLSKTQRVAFEHLRQRRNLIIHGKTEPADSDFLQMKALLRSLE
jgi:hypothetical protein